MKECKVPEYSKFTRACDKFFTSPLSIFIIAVGTVLAWTLENFYIAMGVYGAMFILIALTCTSLIGTVPIFLYAVTSYSVKMQFDWDLIVPLLISGGSLLGLIVLATIVFFIKNKIKFRDCKVQLWGFLAMFIVSFFGGILVGYPKTNLYQYLAGIGGNFAIMAAVFLLSATIRKNNDKFFVHSFIMLAFVVLVETIIYFVRIVLNDGDIHGAFLYKTLTYGWNHSNGGAILMLSAMPFAFYMIASKKGSPVYYLFIVMIIALGVFITQSRSTILVMAVVLLIGAPVSFFCTNRKKEFIQGIIVCVVFCALIYLAYYDSVIKDIIERAKNLKLNSSGRIELWRDSVHEVLDGDIIFGMGFLHILPNSPQYCTHNTILQLFNNFGILGLVAGAIYYFFMYKTLLYKTGLFGFFTTLSMLAFDMFGMLDISMYAPMAIFPMIILVVMGGVAGKEYRQEQNIKKINEFLDNSAKLGEKRRQEEQEEYLKQQENAAKTKTSSGEEKIPSINIF